MEKEKVGRKSLSNKRKIFNFSDFKVVFFLVLNKETHICILNCDLQTIEPHMVIIIIITISYLSWEWIRVSWKSVLIA